MDQKVFFNFPNPTIVNEGPFWWEAIVLRVNQPLPFG